jgi:predicted patatin/cPLA2 family phospholipase
VDVGGSSPSVPTIYMEEPKKHPVIEEVERRRRGESPHLKLALAIEGGGIRGSVTCGMVCSLASSDIPANSFDSVFGSSAGAFVATYYLSENPHIGAAMFYEDNRGGEFIDIRQILLKKRPVVSLDHVVGPVMDERKPVDFQRVIESQRLRILATRLSDLSRHVFQPPTTVNELKNQLKASGAIPAAAGEPVKIGDEQYIDAGLTEPMPYQAAIDEGFDAVLLLSSRPEDIPAPGNSDFKRKLIMKALSRQIKSKRQEILDLIISRTILDAERLAYLKEQRSNPTGPPYIYSIHPNIETPVVGQLEKNWPKIHAGMGAGYLAVKAAFNHPQPLRFNTENQFTGIY